MPIRNAPFQALSLYHQGLANKLISDVEVCAAYDPNNPPTPLPQRMPSRALWDTGASASVLTTNFATQLGLVPTGTIEVHHGGGTRMANTYVVNFVLPNGVQLIGITASDMPATHNHFGCLIGMDVIAHGDFTVSNVGGNTLMSFRTPSYVGIDYVKEARRYAYQNMGRNEPCPCKSGKKFKACCLATV